MTKGQFVFAIFVIFVLSAAQLLSHRYQTTSTNDTVFVVDTLTGEIGAYMVGRAPVEGLKIIPVASRHGKSGP